MQREEELERLRSRLRAAAWLRPVPPEQDRAFWQHDLASTAEIAHPDVPVQAAGMTAGEETAWSRRLGGYWERTSAAGKYADDMNDRYWITTPGGEIAGTIAVSQWPAGIAAVKLYSLYVAPPARRRGLAASVLARLYDAAVDCGLEGIALDSLWARQDTLRFYLARGMWCTGWKRSITFGRYEWMPRYEIAADGDGALVLLAGTADGLRPLLRAAPRGDRLDWQELPLYARLAAEKDFSVLAYGQATLALSCAVRGWPLVRSGEDWANRYHYSDVGGPEGLASKIGGFEQDARDGGWQLRTPVIPGLPPDDDDRDPG